MKNYQFLIAAIFLSLTQVAWSATDLRPYENISASKPAPYVFKDSFKNPVMSYKNTLGTVQDVNFFKIPNDMSTNPNFDLPFPATDVTLNFSCTNLNNSPGSKFGWYYSLWKQMNDGVQKVGGGEIVTEDCNNNPFVITLLKNEGTENPSSYYVGIQSNCAKFPNDSSNEFAIRRDNEGNPFPSQCEANTTIYSLTLEPITKVDPNITAVSTISLSKSQLKNAIPLGSIKTGRMTSALDESNNVFYPANIYSVETYSTTDTSGTNEVPLLFSCTAAAARYTNNWKLEVYNDKNTLVTGYPRFINGSDCGSTLVDDKGGFKFTLPKDSPRYFISVKSACDLQSKKTCNFETSQYNISRDVTKIYTGSLMAGFKPDKFKLNRCGLNANSRIEVKIENIKTWDEKDGKGLKLEKNKTPIKIQIGTMACQILTPDSFEPAELMLGSITGHAEIIDASLTAKDSTNVTLGECAPSNKLENKKAIKVTLMGTKLDLENLNPVATPATNAVTTPTPATNAVPSSNSVVIPVKVDIGDFHCEGKDAFYIDTDKPKIGDKTYSNRLSIDAENYSPPKNLELSKTDSIESATDVRLYYVDSSINSDTVLNFSCDASTRFNNDWKVFVYNNDKTLNGTPYVINGSDCATGKDGDNGVYKITIPKDKGSMRYFVAVKSACEEENAECKVDKSPYILSREIVAVTPVTGTTPATNIAGSFDSTWLSTKVNLGATLQMGQINDVTDAKIYQVDTGTEDANLTFSCNNAVRYQNDWKLLIYDSAKKLKTTTLINGSSCGIGQLGDSGAYAISLTKDSPTYYLVVKSACDADDKKCDVDKSQYQLKRVTATQAATNAAIKPCFGTNCAAVTPAVKPFFR